MTTTNSTATTPATEGDAQGDMWDPELRPWTCIFDSGPVTFGPAENGETQFARVWVYDKGCQDILGRYCVAKTFRMPAGHIRTTQTDYRQRPAAIRYAQNWIEERRAKAMMPVTVQPQDAA